MTVSPTDTAWIDRVIEYLRLGSRGVMVLVDKAHDSHAGYLARAMLKELGQLHEARSAAELRDCPKNAAVLLRLRDPEEVVALNIGRQVVRDQELRVVVWGTPEVMDVLPTKAFDFFDWISHRVECAPRRALYAQVRRLEAAWSVGLPVIWASSEDDLAHALRESGHGADVTIVVGDRDAGERTSRIVAVLPAAHTVSAASYDELVSALMRPGPIVLVNPNFRQMEWALAETKRGKGVVIRDPRVAGREGFVSVVSQEWMLDTDESAPAIPTQPRMASRFGNELARETPDYQSLVRLALEQGDGEVALHFARRSGAGAVSLVARDAYQRSGPSRAMAFLPELARQSDDDARRVRQRLLVDQDIATALRLVGQRSDVEGRVVDAFVLAVAGHWHDARATHAVPDASSSRGALPSMEDECLAVASWALSEESADEAATYWAVASLALGEESVDEAATYRGPQRRFGYRKQVDAFRIALLSLLTISDRQFDPASAGVMGSEALLCLGDEFDMRESCWEGFVRCYLGKALSRLGRRESARLTLLDAEGIIERTTHNPKHPLILVARFERIWLDVVEKKALVEELDAVLAELEGVLWPEHREVVAARALRRRV